MKISKQIKSSKMYKLKDGVNLPKEFKIKVNPKQSEALQLYLFSTGVKWFVEANPEYKEDRNFIIVYSLFLFRTISQKGFNNIEVNLIRFKDYFEKVTETKFPEKWCIEVTEENYKELNIWMHRNWKNYKGYRDSWLTVLDNYNKYFYGESVHGSCHSTNDLISGFTLITTEQFRKQFGILKNENFCTVEESKRIYDAAKNINFGETKLQGTEAGTKEIKAIESNIDYWIKKANYYYQRCKDLRDERYKLSKNNEIERYEMAKEIEQLKKELELYNSTKDLGNAM